MTTFLSFIDVINGKLWNSLLIYLLLGAGFYFSIFTRLIQIRHFKHMFSLLKNSTKTDRAGISSFQALCTSLAARVGTGNLVGVAIALTLGGPGAIFWMWVVAFIGMATSFVESSLAQLFKTKDNQGNYRGGPAYYMEKGLNARWMGILFSIFLMLAFGLAFNAVQANSIAQACEAAFGVNPIYVGIALVVLCGAVIFGGLRMIARTAEIIVPFMAIAYLVLAGWVIFHHYERLPEVFVLIFKSAFGLQQAAVGSVSYAIIMGVKRGLFSNEAGMGSAPNVAAAALPNPPHPASQGYVQMLGVFIDTLVICSATAMIILTSGVLDQDVTQMKGIDLTQQALSSSVGGLGYSFIAIAIFFFAFTSILANYAYAENNLVFLDKKHRTVVFIFRLMALAMVMFGALSEMPVVWKLADTSMALMAITNLIAILLLSRIAFKLARDYNQQRNQGKVPQFNVDDYPEIKDRLTPGIWDDKNKL